jgi:hypothetical protein
MMRSSGCSMCATRSSHPLLWHRSTVSTFYHAKQASTRLILIALIGLCDQ